MRSLSALMSDEGPESISEYLPMLLHPEFHHVGPMRISLRMAVDSIDELAASVAHLFLNLESCHLDVLPCVGVVGLPPGLQNPLDSLESRRAVRVPESSRPEFTRLHAAELGRSIQALTNVTHHSAAWGREEEARRARGLATVHPCLEDLS